MCNNVGGGNNVFTSSRLYSVVWCRAGETRSHNIQIFRGEKQIASIRREFGYLVDGLVKRKMNLILKVYFWRLCRCASVLRRVGLQPSLVPRSPVTLCSRALPPSCSFICVSFSITRSLGRTWKTLHAYRLPSRCTMTLPFAHKRTWEGDVHKCMTGKVCLDFSWFGTAAAQFRF